jgi:Xaa-Pro aminopeptidase
LELFGQVTAAMMAVGGEFPALIPIFNARPVVDGLPVTVGHSMAGRRKINAGEFVTADLCGVYKRYHANVDRGYFVGDAPKALVDRRLAGLRAVRHGPDPLWRSCCTRATRVLRIKRDP